MRFSVLCISLIISLTSSSQTAKNNAASAKWADSVYRTLTPDERIGQLMIARLTAIDLKTMKITYYDEQVRELIKKYNIGGLCIFQGSPVLQANMINSLQAMAKTPIMMSIDAEWGVGMRLIDSVLPLPKQMMLGAMKDATIVYRYGQIVAEQCKRLGLHVNYAPVVDVNNNPNNPVINDRSFGEDKYKVAEYGIQYMKGMQNNGIMASAKHFPGHGDVSVDSHYDLPVIKKTFSQLDSLELYPFRKLIDAGVGSIMTAHLYIPSIENQANRSTSISKKSIKKLLRQDLKFDGLIFTDALEMQGVEKFFPNGASAVEAMIAGNDMILLPVDVPVAISKIKEAIKIKKLSWKEIEHNCKRVLSAKHAYGMHITTLVNTENLTTDLNRDVPAMRKLVAENAITLLSNKDEGFFPLASDNLNSNIAYVGIGINADNAFAKRMRADYNASVYYFDLNTKEPARTNAIVDSIIKNHKKVIIGIHNTVKTPSNNFGLGKEAVNIVNTLQQRTTAITFLFGNAYAVKNFCSSRNLVVCYEDDPIVQNTALDMLQGKLAYKGVLPVTVCDNFRYGAGISTARFNISILNRIDAIAMDAIKKKILPGCVVLVAKDGRIGYFKSFGNFSYDGAESVTTDAVYDLASITKISATTLAVMKLFDEGKLDLKKKLGDYLPELNGTDKATLTIEELLLHEAGLIAYIPFYKETTNDEGIPFHSIYNTYQTEQFSIPVAEKMYMRNDWKDTLYQRIVSSKLGKRGKYIYSDNDFIYLGKVVEAISGVPLDQFADSVFYKPMSLTTMGFNPLGFMPASRIAPTEDDQNFRQQLIRGTVHDQGSAMFGGVAGHAGLFSNARDLAAIMQLLLNGGSFNGRQYLKKSTIQLFTSYQSDNSRRGYGFDKPEKDNKTRKYPYPALSSPPETFGHTGFTGTAAWADPVNNIIFIFLSNAVHPTGSPLSTHLNLRPQIYEIVYDALR